MVIFNGNNIFSNTLFAESFDRSLTWIALKFSLSMLTLCAVVCAPNKANPLTPKCADMWAGPVSLAITKELSLINEASCEISSALPLSKTQSAFIFDASLISFGPGATTTLNFFSIFWIFVFFVESHKEKNFLSWTSFADYENNKEFYEDKINTAKFYFDKVLPRAEFHYKSAISGSSNIMNFKFN